MLTKRIIPCLDIKNGETVKGINFVDLISAGDPVELAKNYVLQGADELVFLDITATVEARGTLVELVKKLSKELNIPFTVGGGISSVADVNLLLENGADKISINSSAVKNPKLINELSKNFGSQCVVVAVDIKFNGSFHEVFTHGGRTSTGIQLQDWLNEVQDLGAGEILLTSMDHDGTKNGFATDLMATLDLTIPVIASGGAGKKEDFLDVFTRGNADAALAASIFHFSEVKIPDLKKYLNDNNVSVRI